MEVIAGETGHVVGLDGPFGSGDPSPFTAEGVFLCMAEAARTRFGAGSLAGLRVAVQGLGHVGMALVERLSHAGARIVAADISDEATAHAGARFGAAIVSPDEILSQKADILAPCALGGVIDEAAIGALRAGMICGSANNQLAQAELARELDRHGILYCPDYVVNAGGADRRRTRGAQESRPGLGDPPDRRGSRHLRRTPVAGRGTAPPAARDCRQDGGRDPALPPTAIRPTDKVTDGNPGGRCPPDPLPGYCGTGEEGGALRRLPPIARSLGRGSVSAMARNFRRARRKRGRVAFNLETSGRRA